MTIKTFVKEFLSIILMLYVYFSVLFILSFSVIYLLVIVPQYLFGYYITNTTVFFIAIVIFALIPSIDLYLISKEKWTPAVMLIVTPIVIYEYLKSKINNTTFSLDLVKPFKNYILINDSFKNLCKPIKKHYKI